MAILGIGEEAFSSAVLGGTGRRAGLTAGSRCLGSTTAVATTWWSGGWFRWDVLGSLSTLGGYFSWRLSGVWRLCWTLGRRIWWLRGALCRPRWTLGRTLRGSRWRVSLSWNLRWRIWGLRRTLCRITRSLGLLWSGIRWWTSCTGSTSSTISDLVLEVTRLQLLVPGSAGAAGKVVPLQHFAILHAAVKLVAVLRVGEKAFLCTAGRWAAGSVAWRVRCATTATARAWRIRGLRWTLSLWRICRSRGLRLWRVRWSRRLCLRWVSRPRWWCLRWVRWARGLRLWRVRWSRRLRLRRLCLWGMRGPRWLCLRWVRRPLGLLSRIPRLWWPLRLLARISRVLGLLPATSITIAGFIRVDLVARFATFRSAAVIRVHAYIALRRRENCAGTALESKGGESSASSKIYTSIEYPTVARILMKALTRTGEWHCALRILLIARLRPVVVVYLVVVIVIVACEKTFFVSFYCFLVYHLALSVFSDGKAALNHLYRLVDNKNIPRFRRLSITYTYNDRPASDAIVLLQNQKSCSADSTAIRQRDIRRSRSWRQSQSYNRRSGAVTSHTHKHWHAHTHTHTYTRARV